MKQFQIIGEVRRLGGMCAVELSRILRPATPARRNKKTAQYVYEHGLITSLRELWHVMRILVPSSLLMRNSMKVWTCWIRAGHVCATASSSSSYIEFVGHSVGARRWRIPLLIPLRQELCEGSRYSVRLATSMGRIISSASATTMWTIPHGEILGTWPKLGAKERAPAIEAPIEHSRWSKKPERTCRHPSPLFDLMIGKPG